MNTDAPTYADYAALIEWLTAFAASDAIDPAQAMQCRAWAEKLHDDLTGLDPTSPLRPAHMRDGDEADWGDEDGEYDGGDEYDHIQTLEDLVSDAIQIIEGTMPEAERAVWLLDARAAVGEPRT